MSNRIPKCDVKIYANVRKRYVKGTQKVRKTYQKIGTLKILFCLKHDTELRKAIMNFKKDRVT